METSWPPFHRYVCQEFSLHAIADATKRELQSARIARAATEARIRLVVLQDHDRFHFRHRLAPSNPGRKFV